MNTKIFERAHRWVAPTMLMMMVGTSAHAATATPTTPQITWIDDVPPNGTIPIAWNMWWGTIGTFWKARIDNGTVQGEERTYASFGTPSGDPNYTHSGSDPYGFSARSYTPGSTLTAKVWLCTGSPNDPNADCSEPGTQDFKIANGNNSPLFTIRNKSPYYLFPRAGNQGAGCDSLSSGIPPGGEGTTSATWCGFVACAVDSYIDDPDDNVGGCAEKGLKDGQVVDKVQGGYASWLGLQPGVSQPGYAGTEGCGMGGSPAYTQYTCSFKRSTDPDVGNQNIGDFTMDYGSVDHKYTGGDKVDQLVSNDFPVVTNYRSMDSSKYPGVYLRGVNVSGLEYDGMALDGLYQRADIPDALYFAKQGMNTIRLPIRAEFVLTDSTDGKTNLFESHYPQGGLRGMNVNKLYMKGVGDTVAKYVKQGLHVILDLHNYQRFCATGLDHGQLNEPTDPAASPPGPSQCTIMTADDVAYVWSVLAGQLADPRTGQNLAQTYPDLLALGLMNEPYTVSDDASQTLKTADVLASQAAAVKAIRDTGATGNMIVMSGNYWDPMHGWVDKTPMDDDQPNGAVFTRTGITNALEAAGLPNGDAEVNKIAIEMHQYYNVLPDGTTKYTGTTRNCDATSYQDYNGFEAAMNLSGLPQWIKDNKMKVFLGEFGASIDVKCQTDLRNTLDFVRNNAMDPNKPDDGGFIGWTAWRANRHATTDAFARFNFLQQADGTVWGAKGTPGGGLGITQLEGNQLMSGENDVPSGVFSDYLIKP